MLKSQRNENRVLFDVFTLNYVLPQFCAEEEISWSLQHSLCLNNLFLGIVLWDRCWIPSSLVSFQQEQLIKDKSITDLFDIIEVIPEDTYPSDKFPSFLPDSSLDEYHREQLAGKYIYSEKERESYLKRFDLYVKLSSEIEANYLPHPARADCRTKKRVRDKFNQDRLIEVAEKQVLQFLKAFDEENDHFVDCTYPLFFDYIRQEADTPITQLEVALELRKRSDVKAFRKSIRKLDASFNKLELSVIRRELKRIREISEGISSSLNDNKDVARFKLELSPTVKYSPTTQDVSVSLGSVSIDGTINKQKSTKLIDITFLSRLIDFGLNDRFRLYE
jgi:hypothetical protein